MSRIRMWLIAVLLLSSSSLCSAEDWPQLKFDARRSGNVPDRSVNTPLGLIATAPLGDALLTAPVVADGRVYVVDAAGVARCFDAAALKLLWQFESAGGNANCNNVCSPALADGYLHFGTMAGVYYVLDATSGKLVKQIKTADPIFAAPVVGNDRVYFVTLGARVHAIEPDGTPCWTWDFVHQRLDFKADRYSGTDWLKIRKQAGWREQFCCTRSPVLAGNTLVVPAGGTICWLEDTGEQAELRGAYCGKREAPACLGLSMDRSGTVYRQWTRRDNGGNVETLRLDGDEVKADYVRGTETSYVGPGLLSFCSVSLRGRDVFRCRPQEGFGLCRHTADGQTQPLGGYPSIASPVLLRDQAVYGALDGKLYVVPLAGGEPWSFATASGKPISAPVAVCDGRVYFGCEDGYLYALGPNGKAPLPTQDLKLHEIRSPLTGELTGAENDWYTSFGNRANTNANPQGIRPPFRLKWIRRFEGTTKHFSVCGGGRMYTHTAEGQIFAVEQQTGRLLWRRYFPGVHVSYTSPVYHQGKLLVPQAGLQKCRLRCLDAATGELLWEAPFTGSPSWNRQLPPIVHKNLVFYQFGTGKYTPKTWLFEHQSTFGFAADQKPLLRAWKLDSGEPVWTRDFSEFGSGGDDAGMCLLDGVLYYSCYFGGKGPLGVTAAVEPETGRVIWSTTKHSVHAGCTVSGKDGRLYLGGYNPVEGKINRVWCLDTADGSLVWKSEPVNRAIHVVTVADRFLFTHSQYEHGYLIDKTDGKILKELVPGYRCTRFTFSEPYLLGPNFAMFDLTGEPKPIHVGPAIDVLVCIGSIASNGRIFYTTNGAGLQASLVYGNEAERPSAPWHSE
ncbi:MAG: PQQ-binding-like beta-propeller repeat protein [Candidatus Nealsonbacteria bacterium]|nr:PQQ-binding-like beta-propeller repeat protein [Candidatus Nealsonbacteria bacterium]